MREAMFEASYFMLKVNNYRLTICDPEENRQRFPSAAEKPKIKNIGNTGMIRQVAKHRGAKEKPVIILQSRQLVPGTELPQVVHLSNVAMKILLAAANSDHFDLGFAVQVALLHDTLEDTDTTLEDISAAFSAEVADVLL